VESCSRDQDCGRWGEERSGDCGKQQGQ